MVDTPQFAWPFGRDASGAVRVVEQGTEEDIRACQEMIARCPLGFREDRPEFGWQPPMFRNQPVNPAALENALRTWEPRGTADATAFIDAADSSLAIIDVQAAGGATQDDTTTDLVIDGGTATSEMTTEYDGGADG